MKQTKRMNELLARMAKIEYMERGKLCRMGERPHYNHQTWQDGRNVVRYVPTKETKFLENAIAGYNHFVKLAEQYADEVIKQTRRQRLKAFSGPHNSKKRVRTERTGKNSIRENPPPKHI
jgi:ribosomal protein S17E